MKPVADRIHQSAKKSYGMVDKALEYQGPHALIHFELGKPCYDTPQHIKQAVVDALAAGDVHYSDLRGNQALREALAKKLADFNGVQVAPDEILITNGLTQASFAAFMATVNPGDEILFLDPYYPQHVGKVELAGGKVVAVALDAEHDFSIRADWIEAQITPNTKGIVLINPCNPTGRVHRREELQALARVAIEHDLLVYTDEVYEYITYDGARHVSIASLPGMAQRTISLYAFTKAYAMDGWRLGYAIAPAPILAAMRKICSSEVTHVNTFIQHGALAAVQGPQEPMLKMLADDKTKRDLAVTALNQMPGIRCTPCEGTIYLFVDIRQTGLSSQALADDLLEKAGVVLEAGSFYGKKGEGYLRLCFGAVTEQELVEGLARMQTYFADLAATRGGKRDTGFKPQ